MMFEQVGNQALNALTANGPVQAMLVVTDANGVSTTTTYDSLQVGNASSGYQLTLSPASAGGKHART
jgi:hypothetical protein